jgi:DNA-binding NtrC family response regulator
MYTLVNIGYTQTTQDLKPPFDFRSATMETEITEDQLQQFLSEGLSQNEIARRTGIPRSTLRRRLKTLGTPDLGVPE